MQWAVGEILQLVKDLGIEKNTLSMFISDHGGQRELCAHGGNNGHFFGRLPFRIKYQNTQKQIEITLRSTFVPILGGKGNFYEGGIRIPAVAHWPGVISPGTVNADVLSTTDILPTFREITGNEPYPRGIELDGKSFASTLLQGNDIKAESRTLLFFCNENLVAARHGKYKIIYYADKPAEKTDFQKLCSDGIPHKEHIMVLFCDDYTFLDQPLIFNVEEDPGEDFPLKLGEYSDVLTKVHREHDTLKKQLPNNTMRLFDLEYMTDSLVPCCNPPYCICNYDVKRK